VCVLLVALVVVWLRPSLRINDDFSPESGAWFGGAVNLYSERDHEVSGNPEDVLTRQFQLCRKYDNLHYYLYGLAISDAQLENVRWAIDENDTPLVTLSWPQRMPTDPGFIPDVAAGRYDAQIAATAVKIKALGGRVLLRPYWEFNHADNGLGAANYGGDYKQFIEAWRRTYTIFVGDADGWKAMGIDGDAIQAENVRFSWTPGNARPNNVVAGVNEDYRPYYPGDEYVDWIGIDSYTGNRMVYLREALAPPTQLVDWYATYAGRGKPMTIGEIGIRPQSSYPSPSPTRADWYANAQAALKAMPMIKLFSYFDVSNETNPLPASYQVDAPGGTDSDSAELALATYSVLANDPYFQAEGGICAGGRILNLPTPDPDLGGSSARSPSAPKYRRPDLPRRGRPRFEQPATAFPRLPNPSRNLHDLAGISIATTG